LQIQSLLLAFSFGVPPGNQPGALVVQSPTSENYFRMEMAPDDPPWCFGDALFSEEFDHFFVW